MQRKIVVVLSGGLDSAVAMYTAINEVGTENVSAVTFNYGQRHGKELECAKKLTADKNIKHCILDMSVIGKQIFSGALMDAKAYLPTGAYADDNLQDTVVPNRNMIMISLATAFAVKFGATEIWLGSHAGDHENYPDCRPIFTERLREVLKVCHFQPIYLKAPFEDYHKSDIVRDGIQLGVPFEDTWSCYAGGEVSCGECTTCNDAQTAFKVNGMNDPRIPLENLGNEAL
jgi:7-cyano-7-deazaguanine synthase